MIIGNGSDMIISNIYDLLFVSNFDTDTFKEGKKKIKETKTTKSDN